jgi:TonB family protein
MISITSRASILRACSLLTASLWFAALAHAQTVIAGQVVHRAKQTPIPNVAVELIGVRDTVLATGISAQDGTFALEAPAGGTYRVRLTALGADAHVSDSVKVADGEYVAHAFPIDPEPRARFEFQVERPVVVTRGSHVKYPDTMRSRGVMGCVLAQWVVDTTGRADTTTFRILKASHTEFAQAVRDALPAMRFTPAELHGQKVRQLVQQPFDFSIQFETRVERRVEVRPMDGRPLPSVALPPAPPLPPPTICGKNER